MYNFYGAENLDVSPITTELNWLRSPYDLYNALSDGLWRRETCAPRMQEEWSEDNKTLGQCSITAFLVQDLFGGEVYGIPREGGHFHCYNVVDGHRFDLTSEQFGDGVRFLIYDDQYPQRREDHFAGFEKKQRYELLRSLVYAYKKE